MKMKRDCDVEIAIDSGCEVDSDPSRICDNEIDSDSDSDSESEFGLIYAEFRDSDTGDYCDAEPKKIRSFLYQHFKIIIVANGNPQKTTKCRLYEDHASSS